MSSEVPGLGRDTGATREPVGEAAQLKTALDGFVTEIKTFRTDVMRKGGSAGCLCRSEHGLS